MRINTVKRMLKEGKPTIGTWLMLPDTVAARYMATIGFDWLNVEMEHSTIGIETAAAMFQVIAQSGGIPLARVPANTMENVKRVLDCGAWGVIFPMQNSREEVEEAVAHCKYPPVGHRSLGGSLSALSFETDGNDYFARANDEILVVVQIEHIHAVEHADEILSVPGVDAMFIGPNDLSASMGIEPSLIASDPRVNDAILRARDAAIRQGVAPGIHVGGPEAARQRIAEGFRFVAMGTDIGFMAKSAGADLAAAR